MAFKNFKGEIERNLQEQVRANKDNDIALAKEIQSLKTLVGFDIKVIDRLDTWEEPTGSFAFGDAIAVGPEGGPFNFYIYTRYSADAENGYWLNYGPISIVGPQGPQGEPGPKGETGKSSKWFVGKNEPSGASETDMWLKVNNDNTTNGFVYQCNNGAWALYTSILGPQGLQGPEGKEGPRGPQGPQGEQGPAGSPSPVINIIGELPEGSVISDTYDPELVESNSGILMPVNGINHLWIIINGIWTDSGSWGGGSSVYAGGQYVQEFNADAYLKKATGLVSGNKYVLGQMASTGATQVYQVGTSSTNIAQYFNPSASGSGVSAPSGCLLTCTPTKAYQCAPKTYVDSQISTTKNWVQTQIAARHDEVHHTRLMWTSHNETITLELGLGFYLDYLRDTIIAEFGTSADFEEWGGTITFETSGGYVYINSNWVYNDAICGKLVCDFGTGNVTLYSIYPGGATSGLPQEMAAFSITGAEVNTAGNLELSMQPYMGLPGGAFTVHSLP